MIEFNLFKYGRKNAVTMSFDDGEFDEKLIALFDKYGIKGTFHLNSFNMKRRMGEEFEKIGEIYRGHEISCHGARHLTLDNIPIPSLYEEIFEDRRELEKRAGYPVCGLSYAFGRYNDEIIASLKNMGICYSRTCEGTNGFGIPSDFMRWRPSCHYKSSADVIERFLNNLEGAYGFPHLLYIWGHAHEIERAAEWEAMEEICRKLGGRDEIWYATNMEIYRYITACRSLVVSTDGKTVFNPSSEAVWFSESGKKYCVNSGEILKI